MQLPIRLPAMRMTAEGLVPLAHSCASNRLVNAVTTWLQTRIIILDRSFTYFKESEVALTRAKDLRAYLRSNAARLCPFPGWKPVYQAQRVTGNAGQPARTRLQIWFYDPQLIKQHSEAESHLLLPEDWLLALSCPSQTLLRVEASQPYLLYAANRALKGTRFIHRDTRQPVEQEFTDLTGLTAFPLAKEALEERLKQTLAQLPISGLSGFVHYSNGLKLPRWHDNKRLVALTTAVLAMWLASGSALVLYQQAQLQQQQAELSEPLRQALADNQREQQLRSQLQELLPALTRSPVLSQLWPKLKQLPLDNTRLSRLALTGYQLQLAGETGSASALLAALSQQTWVESAQFSTPIAKQGNQERFQLVVILHPQALAETSLP